MTEWTETARRTLDEYFARSRANLEGTGADADEVIEDLRRHVDEEVRAAKLSVVTEDAIRRILSRVGEPKTDAKAASAAASAPVLPGSEGPGWFASSSLVLLGVLLPLGTLCFELVTGMSAGVLFDPVPSWFHVLAVAMVPAANLWLLRAAMVRSTRYSTLLGWLNGAALGVCIYYAILYIPFTPVAAMGVLLFGLGLIPLSPYLALIATPLVRRVYARRVGQRLPGFWKGTLAGFGFLVLLQLPSAVTYYGLAKASAGEADVKMHGVRVLRNFGSEEIMLRACYGQLRNREMDMDVVRDLVTDRREITADAAREIYYRVTGRPFNSVPPPSFYTRAGRWTLADEEFTWDEDLGGEAVAGRVKGLSLAGSRLDAVAEPDAAVVYCEWTLEFKNVARQEREARAQIALPPGAVVSRVTLWVNGEEREAAFGGRSEVRKAYQEVAVVQRRDPILVTTCGPDRVLMQCFPVPANGGTMKVRVGITAPLVLDSAERGEFVWPCFLERNFGIPAALKHARWIESPSQLTTAHGPVPSAPSGPRPFSCREDVAENELAKSKSVTVHRSGNVQSVWTPAEAGQVIRQTLRSAPATAPMRIVLVVDGSAGMKSFVPEISEALADAPAATEIALVIASDESRRPAVPPQKATSETLETVRRHLRAVRFVGGQDNLPALETAWDLAAAVERGVVLWIHEPEPVLLSSEGSLRQRIERSGSGTPFVEIQTQAGPDRVLEKLDGLPSIQRFPHLGSIRSDLGRLMGIWSGRAPVFDLLRERVDASEATTSGLQVGRHIDRLWARDAALQLMSQRQREAAMKLAASHQLVTPVTGAVVLETREQFARHGLTPADPATVPSVPEPGVLALLGVGVVIWLLRSRRRR